MRPVRMDDPRVEQMIADKLRPLGLKFDVDGMNVAMFVVQQMVAQGELVHIPASESHG